jgi:HlyD family secretion protein
VQFDTWSLWGKEYPPSKNLSRLGKLLEDAEIGYLPYFEMGQAFVGKVPALKDKEVVFKVNYISPLGSFATWESSGMGDSYDMRTFEIHALPMERVDGLRPGMSVRVEL